MQKVVDPLGTVKMRLLKENNLNKAGKNPNIFTKGKLYLKF